MPGHLYNDGTRVTIQLFGSPRLCLRSSSDTTEETAMQPTSYNQVLDDWLDGRYDLCITKHQQLPCFRMK